METDTKRKLPPFLDVSVGAFSMYDHLPYHRDPDLCTKEMIRRVTGNVVKFYQCNTSDAVDIDPNNSEAEKMIEKGKNAAKLSNQLEAKEETVENTQEENDLSDALKDLLQDNSSSKGKKEKSSSLAEEEDFSFLMR